MFPMDLTKVNECNNKIYHWYVIPEIPKDLSEVKHIELKLWHGDMDTQEAWHCQENRSIHIEFLDDSKQIVVDGIDFTIIEYTDWAWKFSNPRFKKRTIKTTSYEKFKKDIIRSTYDDFWTATYYTLFQKVLEKYGSKNEK